MEQATAESGADRPSSARVLRILINIAAVATVVIAALASTLPV